MFWLCVRKDLPQVLTSTVFLSNKDLVHLLKDSLTTRQQDDQQDFYTYLNI